MAFASGGYHGLYSMPEVSFGVTPNTPDWDVLRHTDCSLQLKRDKFESKELRSDRAITDVRLGTYKVEGDVGFELSYGAWDEMLEALLGGTWTVAYNLTAQSLTVVKTAKTFARTVAGDFVADDIKEGDIITTTGFADAENNGSFQVATVAANLITVTLITGSPVLKDVTDDTGCTITTTREIVKQGTTQRSFSILRRYNDIAQYQCFSGCCPSKMVLDIKPNGMVTGKMSFVGSNMVAALPAGSTYNAAPTNLPMDCFSASIKEGGSNFALASAIQLTLDNGLEADFVVGSKYAPQISWGRSKLIGKLTAFFDDLDLYNKFLNETASSLEFTTTGGTKSFVWLIDNLKYTTGGNDVKDEKPIQLDMDFDGLHDVTNTNLRIDRNPGA